MSRKLFLLFTVLFVLATPVFAQGTTTSTGSWVTGGLAQGKAVASSAEAIARNPGAGGAIRGALLLGLVLIESLALYTLVIIFAKG